MPITDRLFGYWDGMRVNAVAPIAPGAAGAPGVTAISFGGISPPVGPTNILVAAQWVNSGFTFLGMSSQTGNGSLTPNSINGNDNSPKIYAVLERPDSFPVPHFQVELDDELPQNFFESITIAGITYLSADALHGSIEGFTQWFWPDTNPFLIGPGEYPIIIA